MSLDRRQTLYSGSRSRQEVVAHLLPPGWTDASAAVCGDRVTRGWWPVPDSARLCQRCERWQAVCGQWQEDAG